MNRRYLALIAIRRMTLDRGPFANSGDLGNDVLVLTKWGLGEMRDLPEYLKQWVPR